MQQVYNSVKCTWSSCTLVSLGFGKDILHFTYIIDSNQLAQAEVFPCLLPKLVKVSRDFMWILVTLPIPNMLTQGDIMACDEPPERCNQMRGIPCTNKETTFPWNSRSLSSFPLPACYSYKKKKKKLKINVNYWFHF